MMISYFILARYFLLKIFIFHHFQIYYKHRARGNLHDEIKSQSGFSLVELLLSMAITILLTDLIIHLCVNLVNQQNWLKEKITLTENGQFAEFILRKEIQTAGFCGCNRLRHLDIHYHLERPYLPIIPIQIFSRNSEIMGKMIHSESDVIVIEKMLEKTTNFSGYLDTHIIKKSQSDPMIIADCSQADVFVPSAIQDKDALLMHNYRYAEIGELSVTAFFIEKTHRKNSRGQSVSALYSYDFIHHRKTEWVSGIDGMEFFYATGEDGDNIVFKPLLNTDQISALHLIKIVLFLSGESFLASSKKFLHKKQEILIYLREL